MGRGHCGKVERTGLPPTQTDATNESCGTYEMACNETNSIQTIMTLLDRIRIPVHFARTFARSRKRGSVDGVLAWLIMGRALPFVRFVEIGVFKGDKAASIARLANQLGVKLDYIGFDVFEDATAYYEIHPVESALYKRPEYKYFEFESGGHYEAAVREKLASLIPPDRLKLVKGDSTLTVPQAANMVAAAHLVFIDGCHEYSVVRKDWRNVSQALAQNRSAVIVFDDESSEGVAKVKAEIEAGGLYRTFGLNDNQFIVVHKSAVYTKRLMRLAQMWFAAQGRTARRLEEPCL